MATLIFTAIGTAIGGPLGGAIGALVGRQIDSAIIGSPSREGPRLKELSVTLHEAALATADDGFGGADGFARKRMPAPASPLEILRYYDVNRDFQPGLQRASGRPHPGQPASIELPAALTAPVARGLIDNAARRAGWARQSMSWRTAEIDPRVAPGALVRLPGQPGVWRVNDWEWRTSGVELGLWRTPGAGGDAATGEEADAGRAAPPIDAANGPTTITAFELPWDGTGPGDVPAVLAAATSAAAGWSGAALYVDQGDGQLQPLGSSPRARAICGNAVNALAAGSPLLFDRSNTVTVALPDDSMSLADATPRQLAMGANRALLGAELIQFTGAVPLGDRQWRLEGLLRGRGGTETAIASHAAGEAFVLLDGTLAALDGTAIGQNPAAAIVAIGLGDSDPASTPIGCRGLTQRPLFPVHPVAFTRPDGTLVLRWTRRARGAWAWLDGVDTPLHEQAERYDVIVGSVTAPVAQWSTAVPALTLDPALLAAMPAAAAGAPILVRQRGSYAVSEPLLLTHLP